MRALNKDELDQVSGGLITTYGGNYWAVSDTGDAFVAKNSKKKEDIIKFCESNHWSTEEISPEDFEKKFGYKFEPDWVPIQK